MSKINKVRLFVNNNIKSRRVSKYVSEILIRENFEIVDNDEFDLGIAIGGDGAFLRMVNQSNFNNNVLYVGVNAGTLGFAQDVSVDEVESFIKHLKTGKLVVEDIGIQEVTIKTKSGVHKFNSLNEIVIRDDELNILNIGIYIENVLLENYVGDGILISTSFGSTAYNLSFGGSIVYNTFDTLQITPIAPLNNKSYSSLTNSLIIPSNKKVALKVNSPKNLLVTVDGNNIFYNDVISVNCIVRDSIKLIRKKDYNLIQKINDKLIDR